MAIVVRVEMAGKDTANPESRLVDIVGLHPTNSIVNPGAILERRVGQSCNSTQLSSNTSHTLTRICIKVSANFSTTGLPLENVWKAFQEIPIGPDGLYPC